MLEIDLQISAVKALKKMPGYVDDVRQVGPGKFTLAADQNGSGRRGRNVATKLKAAGLAAGEPDVRIYIYGGVLKSIEFKGKRGRLEPSQEKRFPLLRSLGFEVAMCEACSEDEAATKAVGIVTAWLSNDI